MNPDLLLVFVLVCAYLSGSIPFGLLLTKASGAGDLRTIGSGNIGATNVLRTGKKGLAFATLLCDALKAAAPIYMAMLLLPGDKSAQVLAALFAFLGHLFPIWLKFKGGKGVASFLGVLIAFSPMSALLFALVWIGVAFTTKYSSLSALVAALIAPIYFYKIGQPLFLWGTLIMVSLLYIKHSNNILRLIKGQESKIGAQKS